MGRIRVQVCLISARGLRRTSSFWKLQWYAVGWIYPDSKYCTKLDASGSGNPVWNTRFSTPIDPSELNNNLQELLLHVEVYSREPVFLRNSLHGSATIVLSEFLEKYGKESEAADKKPVEEVGSFQLRKKKSDKPVGFVDVSIRVSEDREDSGSSSLGPEEGFDLTLTSTAAGSLQPVRPPVMPFPPNNPQHHQFGGGGHPAAVPASYQPRPIPPVAPPPAASVAYGTYFGPTTPSSYISMPSSVAPPTARGAAPGFGMGMAAGGALAAGAVIYGGDIMSGLQIPGASFDASVSVSTYPPF